MNPASLISEANLQASIIELATLYGWLVYHTHDSRRSKEGFPDLCMVRGNRLIFAELKSARGKVSDEQKDWLDRLGCTGTEAYVWWPADWLDGSVDRVLR